MTARRVIVGGAAAVLTAAALLFGGVFRGERAATAAPTPAKLDQQGSSFLQQARETGDATYYARAERAFDDALRIASNDLPATIGLGALALSRHEFRAALQLGRQALSLSPSTAAGHGVVGDALVELGRYEEAFQAFNRMVSLKPSVASYARVSYARELLGDIAGATQAMRLAIDAAAGQPEALAWSHTQLGKLFWSHGRFVAAEREYRAALTVRPGYPFALGALARSRLSVSLARRATAVMPSLEFVGTLGDLLHASGDETGARRQYMLIAAINRLQRASGVKTDLELALFNVDHGLQLREALTLARASYADRPSIDGDDVLAWALFHNGRCAEALVSSKHALRLGTQDAAKFFHRGMIERCLGNRTEARRWFRRALALNPRFSLLWAPVARRYAA
jgi:tetratricopeptide (TPR) repeat protein